MSNRRHVNAIAGRMSLRAPQRQSLEILDRVAVPAGCPKCGVMFPTTREAQAHCRPWGGGRRAPAPTPPETIADLHDELAGAFAAGSTGSTDVADHRDDAASAFGIARMPLATVVFNASSRANSHALTRFKPRNGSFNVLVSIATKESYRSMQDESRAKSDGALYPRPEGRGFTALPVMAHPRFVKLYRKSTPLTCGCALPKHTRLRMIHEDHAASGAFAPVVCPRCRSRARVRAAYLAAD